MIGVVTIAAERPAVVPVPVCRRGGCREAAGPSELCVGHHDEQARLRVVTTAEPVTSPFSRAATRLLAELAEATSGAWRSQAACRGQTTAFYPPLVGPGQRTDYTAARVLCGACPVIDQCRQAAAHEPHGMWAGTTPEERKPRRRSGRTIPVVAAG
jgi:WhiB family redox-sensing transcriptional regulator